MPVDNPLISIIVPIYNVEAYVQTCIESIRQQTYKNIEIILVDDGSTDASALICDNEASQDNRIEVIHQDNKGLVAARKAGLSIATGDYIGFVDGDDYIDSNMYEELLKALVENRADFVHSGFYKHDIKTNIENDYTEGQYDISKNKISVICKNILKIPFNTENTIAPSIWSKLYKAELIKDAYSVVPDGQSFGEDILCLCVCILKADTMFLTKNAYYHYIIRENSMSHIRESKDIIKYTGLYVSLCNLFKNFNLYDEVDKYLEAFLMQYITSYMSYMYRGSIYIGRYRFGNIHMLRGKKVVIYGAGRVGQDYYCQIAGYKECTIVGWIDKMFSRYKFDYAQVQEISALKSMNYDKLIVAVRDKTIADEIIKTLCELGIEKGKVVWTKPCVCCLPVNKINLY